MKKRCIEVLKADCKTIRYCCYVVYIIINTENKFKKCAILLTGRFPRACIAIFLISRGFHSNSIGGIIALRPSIGPSLSAKLKQWSELRGKI
jgi:hypothetical protein